MVIKGIEFQIMASALRTQPRISLYVLLTQGNRRIHFEDMRTVATTALIVGSPKECLHVTP